MNVTAYASTLSILRAAFQFKHKKRNNLTQYDIEEIIRLPIFIIYNKAIRLSHHLYMLLFFVIMPLLEIPFLPYRYQVSP